jgi:hypothetical protein
MCVGDGETYLIPIEVAEARYGIVVDQFALDPTLAGAGRHRGGRGCIRDYRAAVDGVTITATFGRHKYVPWGIAGGRDGSRNAVHILYEDGREVVVGKTARTLLKKGEVARLVTGTGGGWGDPHERPVEAVVEDVKRWLRDREQAERDYGVPALDPGDLRRDRGATVPEAPARRALHFSLARCATWVLPAQRPRRWSLRMISVPSRDAWPSRRCGTQIPYSERRRLKWKTRTGRRPSPRPRRSRAGSRARSC